MIWLGTAIASVGALLCLTAAIGLLRIPDPLSILGMVGTATTGGILLVGLGTVVALPRWDITIQTGLAVVFLMIVTPISGHLVARAIYRTGAVGDLRTDELAGPPDPPPRHEDRGGR